MQLELDFKPANPAPPGEFLALGARRIPMVLVRNVRARRYLLRVRRDGVARVTIPRGGSAAEARKFAAKNIEWVERELAKREARAKPWTIGTAILFRGEWVKIEASAGGARGEVQFATEIVAVANPAADLRPEIERRLWRLAGKELPPRVHAHATAHEFPARRTSVRNQRSRWGSCSRKGTISLNWRLIQAPPFVCDYIILHELSHLREMNHSARFWREVERVCPDWALAERWLKQNSKLIM